MKRTFLSVILALVLLVGGAAGFAEVAEAQPDSGDSQPLGPLEQCRMIRDFDYQMGEEEISYGAGDKVKIDADNGAGSVACVVNMVYRAANAILWFSVALVVILVVTGAFFILTAGPNEEKVDKGKKFISYSVIGVIIAVFAYAAPWIINFVVG